MSSTAELSYLAATTKLFGGVGAKNSGPRIPSFSRSGHISPSVEPARLPWETGA